MTFREGNQHELTTEVKTHPIRVNLGHNGKNQQDSPPTMTNSLDDTTLCQLLEQILESQDETREQKNLFNRLIALIPRLQGIYRGNKPFDEDAFNEALGNVAGITRQKHQGGKHTIIKFIQTNGLNHPPEKVRENFVKWFTKIVKHRLIDYYRTNDQTLSLDASLSQDQSKDTFLDQVTSSDPTIPNLSELDNLIDEETLAENRQTNEQLRQKFETCDFPEEIRKKLLKKYKTYPQATCHELIKRRHLYQQDWLDILRELELVRETITIDELRKIKPYRTLNSRYSRNCKPLLTEIAQLNLL